jgi:predicted aminopeptidase
MLPEAGLLPDDTRLARLAGLVPCCLALSGCYLLHVSAGQMELNRARQPIGEVLARPETPPAVRARLDYVAQVRHFASAVLGLPDNGSFTSFVELDRPFVVWNVFAAPEFSVEPRAWCFPVAGCVSYRGYFAEAKARDYALRLEQRGDDVYVAPVAAYSTLGHFDDPVLSTMLRYGDVDLAALLFHELAHQVVYVPGDSAFNEAFATVVELEGARRWLETLGQRAELESFLRSRARWSAINGLMAETRARLAAHYASGASEPALREAKSREFARLDEENRRLQAGWTDSAGGVGLAVAGMNNARLAAVSTYHLCVPGFTAMLAEAAGDLRAFYASVRKLSREPAAARAARVCGPASAAGAAAEQGVAAAPALESEVARDDRPHGPGLDAEAGEAVDAADAVHSQ